MKLRNHQFSTPVRTSNILIKPNPPTAEAIKRAEFRDKTYHWNRSDNIRPRIKRSTK